jgi:hypothetical protein
MSNASHIEVDELRGALARVLDRVEAKFGSTVDLAADHYWTLDPRTAFEPHVDQASGMTVAQLSDDVREVRASLEHEDEPTIWHDLPHIVGVLSRIAALDLP